jgi:hypothetical protein
VPVRFMVERWNRRRVNAQATTDFDGDRWSTAPEAAAYDMADELIGGPAGAPESGNSA